MQKTSKWSRGLSLLLCAVLCLTLSLPVAAAEGPGPGETPAATETADVQQNTTSALTSGQESDTTAHADKEEQETSASADEPTGEALEEQLEDSTQQIPTESEPSEDDAVAASDSEKVQPYQQPVASLEDTPAEESQLPLGRAWLTGNYGTAWLSNSGIRPFSVGDTVYISRGGAIYYAYYQTYKYTATVNGQDYLCFCAEPSQSSTTGYYTVSKIDGNTLGGRRLLAAMLRGWGGPLYNEGWFSDNLSDNHRYAFTHALIGVIYSGDTKGLPQNIVEWTQIVITENDQLLADPSSELSQVIDDYTVYVAYNDAGQDMVWMERNSDTVIHLTKTSTNSGITNDNRSYSLAGAVYGVYSDAGCTQLVTTITTDASGKGTSETISQGDYWLKEITPSPGYQLDGEIYHVTADTAEVNANVTEVPANDPVGITLTKIAAEEGSDIPSLAGAQFTIRYYGGQYSSVDQLPGSPTRTWVLETQSVGNFYLAALEDCYKVSGDEFYYEAGQPTLPIGTITIQETKAPDGYTMEGSYLNDSTGQTVSDSNGIVLLNVTQNGLGGQGYLQGGNAYTKEDTEIRGGVKLYKYDADTQEHQGQGEATVAGAKFEIVNRSGASVVVNGVSYDSGEVVYTSYTDDSGLFETAADLLPYGHYEVREATPPSGYTSNGTTSQEFDILEDGVLVDMTAFDDSISNRIVRGDFELRKVDGDFQTSMANVVFKITSEATGESHTFITDENGYFSSAASWIPHTQDTNGGNVDSGLWFGAGDPDNSVGALPYGTYTIEEQPCEANQDYILWTGTVTISRDNVTINLNNVENFQMRLSTSAVFESNGSQWGQADSNVVVIDNVRYENLLANTDYTMVGTLVDQETGAVLTDAQGNPITVSRAFTTTTRNGSLKMEFNFDASNLAGKTLVVFEELYLGHGDAMSADPVIVHADLADESQTIHFPAMDTRATDLLTGINVSYAQSPVSIVDTVSYSNLQAGKRYTLNGTLMDAETGLPVYGADGAPVTATTSFRADAADGTATVTFTFDGSTMAGRTLVVYETLQWYNDTLASHTDLDDPDQTVHLPRIGTTALNSETDDHIGMADREMTLVDTVAYENLAVGKTYTMTGTLYVKSTGEALLDADGNPVSASAEFVAEAADGSVELTFVFDASALAGESIVAYESLTYNGVEVAVHADIDDEGQTVHIPEIGTTAIDAESGTHNAIADETVTIVDTVVYTNLIPGKEYTISGVLYNKATGEPLLDEDDAEITASTTFTAESADGAVEITFQFDGSLLAGETVVAFETLEYQGVEVAIHADINDENQTVKIIAPPPEVPETPTAPKTGDLAMPVLFAGSGLLAAAVLFILVRASKKGHGEVMQ